MYLFAPLVDLPEELRVDLLLHARRLVNGSNLLPQLGHARLLVLLVVLLEVELIEQLLDLGLALLVLLAVVLLEELALLGCHLLQRLVDQPRALVVLDVCADLAKGLRVGEVVQVVVLHLEVLAHGDEDVLCLLEVGGRGLAGVEHGEGNGEVEAVVCGLVDDDEGVLLEAEVVEVDVVFGCGEKIAGLAKLGLESDFLEQLDDVDVGRVAAEVLLEEDEDGGLEHEGVVDGDHADLGLEVPAGLAAAGLGRVHDVVGDEEEGLEELDHPAESGRVEVLLLGEVTSEEQLGGVDNGQAAVTLAANDIVVEGLVVSVSERSQLHNYTSLRSTAYLLEPLKSLCGELVLLAVLLEVGDQLGEDTLELLQSGGHVDGSAGQVGAGD